MPTQTRCWSVVIGPPWCSEEKRYYKNFGFIYLDYGWTTVQLVDVPTAPLEYISGDQNHIPSMRNRQEKKECGCWFDKFITADCGLYDILERDDEVMVDRGFQLREELMLRFCSLRGT